MGAGSRTIFASYGLQIGLVALGAVALGAGLGAAVPWVIVAAAGDALPVPPTLGLYPLPLLTAAAYGLLIAAGFAVVPLVRAQALPAARLLRDAVEPARWPGWGAAAMVARRRGRRHGAGGRAGRRSAVRRRLHRRRPGAAGGSDGAGGRHRYGRRRGHRGQGACSPGWRWPTSTVRAR